MSSFLNSLTEHFPSSLYNIQIKDVFDTRSRRHITLYKILDKSLNDCITVIPYMDLDELFVFRLDKCSASSGLNLLKNIESFAKENNFKLVSLSDASNIYFCWNNIDISLKNLNILANGQSWYNKHDYKSANFTEEQRHNLNFIKQNFKSQLLLSDAYNKSEINSVLDYLSNILNNSQVQFMTVQEVFTELQKYLLNNGCKNSDDIYFIRRLVNAFSENIEYNDFLTKNVGVAKGGKQRKKTCKLKKKSYKRKKSAKLYKY